MAEPAVQRRVSLLSSLASKLLTWLDKLGSAFGRPLFSVVLALVAAGVVIIITAQGTFSDRFSDVGLAFQYLYLGSFGTLQSTALSLVKATALIFTGLSVAIAFRAGLFNIGAAGQLTVGAVTAGIIALALPKWPGWVLIPMMIIASALAGAIWGGIVGALKAWRGAHEVVTTIMLNWIAFFVAAYLIDGPFQGSPEQTAALPAQATLSFVSIFYNQTLGTFLPAISTPTEYTVDVGIILALIMLVVYWFITSRTTFGYELRVVGQNPKAAKYAGISIKRSIIVTMALAGAMAGLAGSIRLMGQPPHQLVGPSFAIDTTGFDAIGVALLGRTTAIGILLAALLFGGLQQAGPDMELFARVPNALVYIIEALVLLSVATEFLPAIQRTLPRWMLRSRTTARVPDVMAASVTDIPVDVNGEQAVEQAPPTDKTTMRTDQEE